MEAKDWIKEKAQKITDGYKEPFTGEVYHAGETWVHFKMFAVPLKEANKYDSFDELLKAKLV